VIERQPEKVHRGERCSIYKVTVYLHRRKENIKKTHTEGKRTLKKHTTCMLLKYDCDQ